MLEQDVEERERKLEIWIKYREQKTCVNIMETAKMRCVLYSMQILR